MIFADSRYASGTIYRAFSPKLDASSLVVTRTFPNETSTFIYYVWKQGDRIENVAARLLDNANLWWRIMDFNPEIANPFSIAVGTLLRVPYDS